MSFIDAILNKITMYRLTLYYLIALVATSVVLAFLGVLSYSPTDILIQSGLALITCYIANWVFSKFFGAVTNIESVFITALILALIVPVKFPANSVFIVMVSGLAMASKYFLTIEKRHIFNPAAAAIAGFALLSPEHTATWWVGTPAMLVPVLVGGYLLIRRIRRENLVLTFLITYLLIVIAFSLIHSGSVDSILISLEAGLTHSALLFFAFVMLTEPLTTPGRRMLQNYYAIFVAVLYATPQIRLIGLTFTPEMALCAGNVFSYFINPNYRMKLALAEKIQLSPDTLGLIFNKNSDLKYEPGQYMEWTLPHKSVDDRGNRRYFSLTSSPTENEVSVAVKFYDKSSSFKKTLLEMDKGESIVASQVAGDFVLPKVLKKPLVFVAGGVGMAPFRSMIKYIIDKKLSSDICLLYSVKAPEDVLFKDLLRQAAQFGVKTFVTITDKDKVPPGWQGGVGYITAQMIQTDIPDFKTRTFYVSGPQLMVQSFEELLAKLDMPKNQVITDYFPGYLEKR